MRRLARIWLIGLICLIKPDETAVNQARHIYLLLYSLLLYSFKKHSFTPSKTLHYC